MKKLFIALLLLASCTKPQPIEIIDEGPGVHEKLKQKVFLPLVTDKKIGTGLGLSITQRLLKLNDSYIEYENNRVGATFRIVLPMGNH